MTDKALAEKVIQALDEKCKQIHIKESEPLDINKEWY